MRTPTFYNTEVNRIVDISQTPCPAMLDQQFPRPQVTYWSTGAATIPTTMTIGQGQTRLDQMSVKQTHLGGGGKLCATCCIFRWPTSLGQEPTQSVDKEYLSCFTRKLSSSEAYWLASRFCNKEFPGSILGRTPGFFDHFFVCKAFQNSYPRLSKLV